MSSTQTSIHVRRAGRAAVLAQVERHMGARGLELVDSPSLREPILVRVRLVERGEWVSLAIEDLERPDEWARALARELGVPSLAAASWDEPSVTLTMFEGTARPARLSLPSGARRASGGRLAVALGRFSRLAARANAKKSGLEMMIRAHEASFDEDDRCVYLPIEVAEHALARAFGLEELFIDPLDEDARDEILYFRAAPTSALAKRARAEAAAQVRARRAAYDGRLHTVGWLALDVAPNEVAEVLDTTSRRVVETLTPHLRSRPLLARAIDPAKGETALPPPAEEDHAWRRYARALRDGKLVELRSSGAPVLAGVWLVLRERALVVGWSMRVLKEPAKRTELAVAQADILTASTEDARCFGALMTCQQPAMSIAQQALAYEYLRDRSALALRPHAHRSRARAPGWRVLIPRAAPALEGAPPPDVSMRRVNAGLLLHSHATDPHQMTPAAMDVLESYLEASDALAHSLDVRETTGA